MSQYTRRLIVYSPTFILITRLFLFLTPKMKMDSNQKQPSGKHTKKPASSGDWGHRSKTTLYTEAKAWTSGTTSKCSPCSWNTYCRIGQSLLREIVAWWLLQRGLSMPNEVDRSWWVSWKRLLGYTYMPLPLFSVFFNHLFYIPVAAMVNELLISVHDNAQ